MKFLPQCFKVSVDTFAQRLLIGAEFAEFTIEVCKAALDQLLKVLDCPLKPGNAHCMVKGDDLQVHCRSWSSPVRLSLSTPPSTMPGNVSSRFICTRC
ncbi:hypothetical protein [Pseudoduganella sp. HUAS MS19]